MKELGAHRGEHLLVRREIGELTRECTRCWLSFLGGSAARKGVSYVQELSSEGSGSLQLRHVWRIEGWRRGSRYSSLGGSSRGGAPGTHLPICHLEEGCILSRSYVIAVSIH